MSFDLDEREFYETFDEISADTERGFPGAKEWAWSALQAAYDERDALRAQRDEAVRHVGTYEKLVKAVERVRRAYRWVRGIPRRLKYRFFPVHRIKRKTFPNGTTITTVPLAPGMVPEEKIYDADTAPIQTPRADGKKGPFQVIVGALTMVPRNIKKEAPPAEKK